MALMPVGYPTLLMSSYQPPRKHLRSLSSHLQAFHFHPHRSANTRIWNTRATSAYTVTSTSRIMWLSTTLHYFAAIVSATQESEKWASLSSLGRRLGK